MVTFFKDPNAELDYSFDWRPWLIADDEIATFEVTSSVQAELEVMATPAPAQAGGIVTFWLKGGLADADYTVQCRVVTTGGRTDDRTMRIKVRDR